MSKVKIKNKKKWIFIPILIVAGLTAGFFIYVSIYYHAEPEAFEALVSDDAAAVTRTDYGWFFDGPSDEDLLVFYPGAKVEAVSYAPFLKRIAENGMDVSLVEMPFNLAVFGINKADDIISGYPHENIYVGGHSLGGSMAAEYAASHSDRITGLVLCAAYPTKQLDSSLIEISIYGTEDRILNKDKYEAARQYAPAVFREHIIEGGNHAFFGSYGEQNGDGKASITPKEQQLEAALYITS